MTSAEFEGWLTRYREGAAPVEAALRELFQQAMTHWVNNESGIEITESREFLRKKRSEFLHRILFFTYSSRFDKAVESEILDTEESRAPFAESLQPIDILSRKAELLEPNFKRFIHHAHVEGNYYTVALSANTRLCQLPLVWTVPAEDEAKTGFPSDFMWQATFMFLCEISQAIVAYGGFSSAFWNELQFIRRERALVDRLLWLDQNGRLFFPDRDQETWPMSDIAKVLKRIK
jgi:competence CoiA-like predicted nuclease